MAVGLELGLERPRARRQPRVSEDGDPNTEFVSKLKRDREEFKRDHPLPPLPSGAADAASKRQHVAPPASPAAQPPSPRPPPYELLVESPEGDVQSYPIDPALPLRDTLLCHELPPDWHLRVDGDRLDTAQSASALGLARGAVLQAFAPQAGGGYEEGDDFEAALEVEREMLLEEAEHGQSRRRQREGGVTNEGSGEAAPQRQRQRVAVESPSAGEAEGREEQESAAGGVAMGNASDGDGPMAAPISFQCAICASEKNMESAVKLDGCEHPGDRVCGSCLFTEVCGNAAWCPLCRKPASALEQVATGRRYEVTETTLSRLDTQGGEPAETGDPNACHTCHKFGFLLVCDGGCEQNRCLKCSGLDWPPEGSFSCETCAAEARAATPGPPDASATQSDVGSVAMAGEQQARQAQQERQTKAQQASARAAKFQEQQRGRVHAPAIAESGMQPWGGVSVEVAQLDEFKVRCESGLGI